MFSFIKVNKKQRKVILQIFDPVTFFRIYCDIEIISNTLEGEMVEPLYSPRIALFQITTHYSESHQCNIFPIHMEGFYIESLSLLELAVTLFDLCCFEKVLDYVF